MKNTYKLIAISTLALSIALPAIAQTDNSSDHMTPPPTIRARIRADINARVENAGNNQNVRNILERRLASTTAEGDMPRPRPFMASTTIMASTTMRERMSDEDNDDRGMRADMRVKMFEMRKHMITKELDVSINNLGNISSRLDSRIDKEQVAGHDMTDATSALASANIKIQAASDAVSALESYLADISVDATASTTIDLAKARDLTSDAQSAIKDAQRALNNVVVTIAHALGIKLEAHAEANTSSTVSQ